ncbi:GAF and ANTAR domain-containing protein [Luteipulveratus flavus]|uniref:GAF and ANTAR domain-containing protein n=1 Tax=Luteipulveratus flavus TaxID=3031728 RepID=A0ABT6CC12_9MICO|nr:GAF and ANTAR domain-containing protein [Luteipulveratus sp. YIM 133296]MDF8266301.1 GAF and ANTAR domain-containing protein [Luteipulveratus sp. YIM 133296]
MDNDSVAREIAELAQDLHSAETPAQTAEQVVAFAQQQSGADYAGISLIGRGGKLETIAPTDPLVRRLDELQDELDEGPCHDSAWEQDTLVSSDLRTNPRWPRWAPRAADLGVGSAMGAELSDANGRRMGAVNLFWRRPRTFTPEEVGFMTIFARHAALALDAARTQDGLRTALDARGLIGQAQGILMERHRLDQDQAFEVLRRYSQNYNLKLREVAERLVLTRSLPDTEPSGGAR